MNVFKAIGGFFKKIFGWVIKSDPFKQLVAELMPVAIDTVTRLAQWETMTSSEKREAALTELAREAELRGLQFRDHMLALLVEMAVAKLKGTIGEEK